MWWCDGWAFVLSFCIIMSPHMRKTDGKCFGLYLFCGFQFKKRPHHSTFDSVFIFIPKETQLWKCGLMFFVSIYVTTLPFWWIRETIKFIFNEILYPEPHIWYIYKRSLTHIINLNKNCALKHFSLHNNNHRSKFLSY